MMPRRNSRFSIGRALLFAASGMYVICCLVLDFWPRFGPPDFRYTGSDPAIAVWNLGWPLAEFIYDPRSGLHEGPTAFPLIAIEAVIAAVVMCASVTFIWRRRRRAGRGFPVALTRPIET
jgi:hypothetical protein